MNEPPTPSATAGTRRWNPTPRMAEVSRDPTRHIPIVGFIKYGLIGLTIGLVALVAAWPRLFADTALIVTPVTDLRRDELSLQMVNARYTGTDGKNRPYVIAADTATQDPTDLWRVRLDQLRANITLRDGTWLSINARTGVWHQKQKVLKLLGGINIFSDIGYELRAEDARIDLERGHAASDHPVRGEGPLGLVQARNFEVSDYGDVIRFGGGVKLTVLPGKG